MTATNDTNAKGKQHYATKNDSDNCRSGDTEKHMAELGSQGWSLRWDSTALVNIMEAERRRKGSKSVRPPTR